MGLDFLLGAARMALADAAVERDRYRWECDRDDCDGQPHDGNPHPHARTKQRKPKGRWKTWLLLCGRGFGKTRTGSEVFLDLVLQRPVDAQGRPTWHLIGCRTHAETVQLMIEGPSSLTQAMDRRGIRYTLNKSNYRITLESGQIIVNQHAEGNADFGRGGEWATVWIDEIGTFKRIKEAFTQSLPFAMRVKLPHGERSRMLLTTTPKAEYLEPFEIMKDLVGKHGNGNVVVVRGTTWENVANIPEDDLQEWEEDFPPGTRTRRQELDAELLDNVEGSLWTAELIGAHRLTEADVPRDQIIRRIVSVDPAYTAGPNSDLTGIMLVSKAMLPVPDTTGAPGRKKQAHYYVERDLSMKAPINQWAETAVKLAVANDAQLLIEVDNGADMNAKTLREAARDLGVACPKIHEVRAGSEGSKAVRAAPVVADYENGRVHHVGYLAELETQQCTWVPEDSAKSPDRIDALVHAVRHLRKQAAGNGPVRSGW